MSNQWVHSFQADNGLEVRVRQLCPDDVPCLLQIFEKMSPQSRYMRFNEPLTNPDPEWLLEQAYRLSDIPPDRGCGWLAFADLPGEENACVGGIRCLRVSDELAEISLVVWDDLQGIGIGSNLLDYACRKAYTRGFKRVIGIVQSYNVQLWHSLKRLGIPTTRQREGTMVLIEADLTGLGLDDAVEESENGLLP
jgi:acetyltransferase